MEYIGWILEKGSQINIIWLAGFAVVGMGKYFINRQDKINAKAIRDQEKLNDKYREDQLLLWTELKEAIRLYHQVDKLESQNSLAIRFLSDPDAPIETMKQSADGKGDHALNRDV